MPIWRPPVRPPTFFHSTKQQVVIQCRLCLCGPLGCHFPSRKAGGVGVVVLLLTRGYVVRLPRESCSAWGHAFRQLDCDLLRAPGGRGAIVAVSHVHCLQLPNVEDLEREVVCASLGER